MGRVLSHGQLVIESHTEHDSEFEQGSGPEHNVRLGGKVNEQHKSNRSNKEGKDSDWKSMEGHDSEEKKPKEGYG